jgi:hypothetical protein
MTIQTLFLKFKIFFYWTAFNTLKDNSIKEKNIKNISEIIDFFFLLYSKIILTMNCKTDTKLVDFLNNLNRLHRNPDMTFQIKSIFLGGSFKYTILIRNI